MSVPPLPTHQSLQHAGQILTVMALAGMLHGLRWASLLLV